MPPHLATCFFLAPITFGGGLIRQEEACGCRGPRQGGLEGRARRRIHLRGQVFQVEGGGALEGRCGQVLGLREFEEGQGCARHTLDLLQNERRRLRIIVRMTVACA